MIQDRSEKERRLEANSTPPVGSREESPGQSYNSTKADGRKDLTAAFGAIFGHLPVLILLATLVFAVTVLYFGQTVLIPVAFSLLLTFVLSPLVDGLERTHIGRVPSVILVVFLTFSVLASIGWLVTAQIGTLAGELPSYTRNIKQKVVDLRHVGKGGAIEQVQKTVDEIKGEMDGAKSPAKTEEGPREVIVEAEKSSTFWPVPTIAGPLLERLASVGLAIILVVTMLIERNDLRNRLIRLIGYGRIAVTTKALEDAGARISRYLLMQSIINTGYGLAVGIGLFLLGLPYAILWGFLAAVLRFVPYIGPWVGAGIPSVLALGAFEGWFWPIMVVGMFVFLELLTNMILEPLLYGDSAGVSKVALLVSLAFWTWVWGPIGLIMATPLTVCLVVLGKYVPQLEYLAVLMSDQPIADKNMIFYQRLLAMDRDEAAQIVEKYVESEAPEQVYDEIMVPALNFARLDRERDGLSDEQEEFILRETRAIVAHLASPNTSTVATVREAVKPCARILGCPARDDLDEIALLMLQQLLDATRYETDVMGAGKLASEVVAEAGEKQVGLVCLAALQPGGLTYIRYLCRRLRAQFSDLKIVVGLWGFQGELEPARKVLLSAGADHVGTSLLETREQISNLALLDLGPGFEPSAAPARAAGGQLNL